MTDDVSPATAEMSTLADVAQEAVRAGGDYLEDCFRDGDVEGTFGDDDVKAAADRRAEERILAVVEEAFPDHAVHAEESGRRGSGPYEWVVDPLDGTNNFASGLPAFASAIAVLHDGVPVVSAVYEPVPDDLYLARRGEGATLNGAPLAAENDRRLAVGTVSFVVGLDAVRDPTLSAEADRIREALSARCKRVLETWSPCVDWGLLAGGRLEGIVCFHPDVYEQHAGRLLAAESGVEAVESASMYVGSPRPAVVSELSNAVDGA